MSEHKYCDLKNSIVWSNVNLVNIIISNLDMRSIGNLSKTCKYLHAKVSSTELVKSIDEYYASKYVGSLIEWSLAKDKVHCLEWWSVVYRLNDHKIFKYSKNAFSIPIINKSHRCVEWWLSNNMPLPPNASKYVVARGGLQIIKAWYDKGLLKSEDINITYAAINGDLPTIKWWYQTSFPSKSLYLGNILCFAIKYGKVDVYEWALQIITKSNINVEFHHDLLIKPSSSGNLNMLNLVKELAMSSWFAKNGSKIYVNETFINAAAYYGHLLTLKWLKQEIDASKSSGYYFTYQPIVYQLNNYMPIINHINGMDSTSYINSKFHIKDTINERNEVLLDKMGADDENSGFDDEKLYRMLGATLTKVCSRGHLPVVKWLIRNYELIDYNGRLILDTCLKNNKLDILEWIISKIPSMNDLAIEDKTVHDTCHNGHLNVLKWIYKKQGYIRVNQWAIDYASGCNHGDVLKWLFNMSDNLIYSEIAIHSALNNDCFDSLDWWLSRGDVLDLKFSTEKISKAKYSCKAKKYVDLLLEYQCAHLA